MPWTGPSRRPRPQVAPVLLGAGVRLYGAPGATEALALEQRGADRPGQATTLRFRVPSSA
jgi:hypothetical protein